jgi:hypothetical protein
MESKIGLQETAGLFFFKGVLKGMEAYCDKNNWRESMRIERTIPDQGQEPPDLKGTKAEIWGGNR